MPYIKIKNYSIVHSIGGYSAIILYLENGEKLTFDSIPISEARYLVDILRNEKPVWWDNVKKYIISYMEPVGEGE